MVHYCFVKGSYLSIPCLKSLNVFDQLHSIRLFFIHFFPQLSSLVCSFQYKSTIFVELYLKFHEFVSIFVAGYSFVPLAYCLLQIIIHDGSLLLKNNALDLLLLDESLETAQDIVCFVEFFQLEKQHFSEVHHNVLIIGNFSPNLTFW